MMATGSNHPAGASVLRHTLMGVALALLPGSCGPGDTAPAVTSRLVQISAASASMLERGYRVHQAKCAKCHSFENPARYPADTLTGRIMPEMARKSNLEPGDAQAVLAYLLAARQLPPPPASR